MYKMNTITDHADNIPFIMYLPRDIMGVIGISCGGLGRTVLTHVCREFVDMFRGNVLARDDVCAAAADENKFEVLKWAFATGYNMSARPQSAAAHGNIEMLDWIRKNGVWWESNVIFDTFKAAARAGHLNVIKWIISEDIGDVPTNIHLMAAKRGHQHIVDWCLFHGSHRTTQLFAAAAKSGNFGLLKWLRDEPDTPYGVNHHGVCPWNSNTFCMAAEHGNIEILEWLRRNDCPYDSIAYPYAAHGGHLDVIKWLHDNDYDMDSLVWDIAATRGHLDILKWLIDVWPDYKSFDCVYASAAEYGQIHVIEGLLTIKRPAESFEYYVCACTAFGGQPETLKWLYANGFAWNELTCIEAVRSGSLECLKYAHENGCPWNSTKCVFQATLSINDFDDKYSQSEYNHIFNERLKILKYLVREGCVIDNPKLCANAAKINHLPMLKWLRKHGCPWDENTCDEANYEDIDKWIHENGCPKCTN